MTFPVICIHSSGLSSRQWKSLKSVLGAEYEVSTPDLMGYGGIPFTGRESFSFDDELALLEPLLRPDNVLVGHSYGGFLALKLALRHSDKVKGVVVFDPIAWGALRSKTSLSFESLPDSDLLNDKLPDQDWLRLFVEFWGGREGWDSMAPQARAAMEASVHKTRAEVNRLILDSTPHQAYRILQVPTLLVGGSRSPQLEKEVVSILGEELPRATVAWMDCGHMGPITHADEFNRLVIEFLHRLR